MSIYDHFQRRRDAIASLASNFGVSGCRSLIVVRRQANTAPECHEIEPRPIVEIINPRLIELNSNLRGLQFEVDDLKTQIPKTYSRSDLTGAGVSFLLDGEIAGGQPVGGTYYVLLPGMDIQEQDLHWDIFLRRRKTS